jgi:hypothetical protein
LRINFQAFVYEFGDEENARRYRDKQYEEAKKNWCDKNGIALKRIEEMRKIIIVYLFRFKTILSCYLRLLILT